MNTQPDYVAYSLEQLERARRSIDAERFPERTALLDDMIRERRLRHTVPRTSHQDEWPSADEVFSDFSHNTRRQPDQYQSSAEAKRGVVSLTIVTLLWSPILLLPLGLNGFWWIASVLVLLFLIRDILLRQRTFKRHLERERTAGTGTAPIVTRETTSHPLLRISTPRQAIFGALLTPAIGTAAFFLLRNQGIEISNFTLPFFATGALAILLLITHFLLKYVELRRYQIELQRQINKAPNGRLVSRVSNKNPITRR